MVSWREYPEESVEAARRVMLELARLLGEYRDDIVVIGGWVPGLLLRDAAEEHIGSIDVDLALDHNRFGEVGYRTVVDHLLSRGYIQGKQPFIFHRTVTLGDRKITVEVDFLAGEYSGTGIRHRTQKVQDMRPRKGRGIDLVFQMPVEIEIRGTLPDGGLDVVVMKVASIPSFIVMKCFALSNRIKEKDAWDIYFCVRYFPGGVDALIREFHPLLSNNLVQEALANLAEKFSAPTAVGPTHVADFEEIDDPSERELIQRDAFERINYLLRNLGFRES